MEHCGSKVDEMPYDIVEFGKMVREFVKKYADYKFSVTTDTFSGGRSIKIYLVSGKGTVVKDGHTLYEVAGSRINEYNIDKCEILTDEVKNMLLDVYKFVQEYHYVDSDPYTDYYNTNFYYDIEVSYDYIDETKARVLIDKNSFVKTYADLYRQINGKKMKVENHLRKKEYVGTMEVKSKTYALHFTEDGKERTYFGDKENKFTRIIENGFEKLDGNGEVVCRYTFIV